MSPEGFTKKNQGELFDSGKMVSIFVSSLKLGKWSDLSIFFRVETTYSLGNF